MMSFPKLLVLFDVAWLLYWLALQIWFYASAYGTVYQGFLYNMLIHHVSTFYLLFFAVFRVAKPNAWGLIVFMVPVLSDATNVAYAWVYLSPYDAPQWVASVVLAVVAMASSTVASAWFLYRIR
jgi:hypothetical protein